MISDCLLLLMRRAPTSVNSILLFAANYVSWVIPYEVHFSFVRMRCCLCAGLRPETHFLRRHTAPHKQPAEGWALWKRTGLPNTNTVLALTDMRSSGASLDIPRRAPLPLLNTTSANYENQKAAYDRMSAIPGFGLGPTDAFGRVWWDVE